MTAGPQLHGVNRAGAEYGEEWSPAHDGWTGQTYYEWPSASIRSSEFDHYVAKGMTVIRLPISWERLQHSLNGPLDAAYQASLVDYVDAATTRGFAVIVDLHNYGRYATDTYDSAGMQVSGFTQHRLGDGTLRFDHVADVWTKIAGLFPGNPRVIFNLMNEQHGADPSLDSTAIFAGYQTVLDAVRAAGATQLVLFPNTRSSDTHHWTTWSPQGGPLDAVAALGVTDSANNLAFDMHSYTEAGDDWNGDIAAVTAWAHDNGRRLFLSEFATTRGAAAVSTLLSFVNARPEWLGWTVWNLEPYAVCVTDKATGVVSDTARMAWYAPYI